jgi:hypothetical protein
VYVDYAEVMPLACYAKKVHIVREYYRALRYGNLNLLFIGQAKSTQVSR